MQFNTYKGGNILVHYFTYNKTPSATEYQMLVNKKIINSFCNYSVTIVSDIYQVIDNIKTCTINEMSERLVDDGVVVFIGIAPNRYDDIDFIAKTHSLICDRKLTFIWICDWINSDLPITLIKDSYKSCYVRISPLYGHALTDIDRTFISVYNEANPSDQEYSKKIENLVALAIMQYRFATGNSVFFALN